MKNIKLLTAILLSAALLTGCELIYPESSDSESTSSSESSSDSTGGSSAESTVSDNSTPVSSSSTTIIKPEPPEIKPVVYPEMELKLSSEMEDIMELFGDFGAFNTEYLWFDADYRVTSRGETDGFTDENGIYFGKVINASITTYSALIETLKSMLTDKYIEKSHEHILNYFRTNENDELFLRGFGAGGYLGYDYLRINSIDYPDKETIMLDMSTVGEKENWGLEEDDVRDFKITLKRTDSGLRIDDISIDYYLDFVCLGLVVYNNVYMALDNAPEYVKKAREESGWQRQLNETEEIIKLLEDYSDFYFAMTPSKDIEKFMDKSQKISIDGIGPLNNPYTAEYYKAVGLPANTLNELNEKLDEFVTEKPKNDFLKITDDKFFTVADNGDLYMSNNPYGRGLGLGTDTLYLDSIEYPDDNTILVTVTSFGDKDNWDTDKDIENTATAKIVKTEDGLRIDEYDINIIDYFGYYNEIIYNDTAK